MQTWNVCVGATPPRVRIPPSPNLIMKKTFKEYIFGILFCAIFAIISCILCKQEFFAKINLNSLTLAILVGILVGNLFQKFLNEKISCGVTFCAKKLLRLAIILYGFRITFQQIFAIGTQGLIADIIMFTTTYLIGYYLGTRVFKLDKDLCMLTAIGSSVCGAAAVLGTNSMLKSDSHKVSLAVSTVVLFGTISMFLHPFLSTLGILDTNSLGIYIGSTVHEVAQVVAAGNAISAATCDNAVIVKLTRVMLLVPYLFCLGFYLSKKSNTKRTKTPIPWFAILFVLMCAINSLNIIPETFRIQIIEFDVFLLTMAMFGLGVETNLKKIKGLGIKPIILAGIMFIWLICFGAIVCKNIA